MAPGFRRLCRLARDMTPGRTRTCSPARSHPACGCCPGQAQRGRGAPWVATDLQVEGQRWSSRRAGCLRPVSAGAGGAVGRLQASATGGGGGVSFLPCSRREAIAASGRDRPAQNPCYDQLAPLMRSVRADFGRPARAMEELARSGGRLPGAIHEDANGPVRDQLDFFADALVTARPPRPLSG